MTCLHVNAFRQCSALAVIAALMTACSDFNQSTMPVGPIRAPVEPSLSVGQAQAWRVMSTQNPSTSGNEFKGIAAISPSAVWAVGTKATSTGSATLIERYTGDNLRVVPSPNPGAPTQCGSGNVLSAASGTSASDVWAVGIYWSCSLFKPLIVHWDGAAWAVVPGPVPSTTGYNQLNAVAAASPSDAWAVGTYDAPNGAVTPFIEHWNGSTWRQVPGATKSATNNTLNAVAIVSGSDIWAAGTYLNQTTGRFFTLIEHGTGSSWSVVPSPSPGNYNANVITGLAALSANNVWAVGYYDANNGARKTLILHWNGAVWSLVPSPNVSTTYGSANVLNGVVALAANSIWAVGHFNNGNTGNQQKSFTLHWDGTAWSIVTTPSPGVAANLNTVSVTAGHVLAAGITSAYGNDYQGFFTVPTTLLLYQ
jgi:hypothetical protein